MTKEIVTLQFGNYTNYIGTHWWNIQESTFNYDATKSPSEINHDILYREGVNSNRHTTYTPRLLLVDLDGALKHLPKTGELYGHSVKRVTEAAEDVAVKKLKADLASNKVEVIEEPVVAKHDFQKDLDNPEINVQNKEYNFSENVESWVDFSYARFHPRTVHIVKQYKHFSDKETLDTFNSGVQLWRTEQFEEDFSNNIRQYVEECDYLQGFQMIFDCFNGFSGLAMNCLEYLNDEYHKANFSIPVFKPKSVLYENADAAMTDSIRVVNSVFSFNALFEQSTLFVPLSTARGVWRQISEARLIPHLNYQHENLYQTASILAAYLDTISLRYRLRESNSSLGGFCCDLNNSGRKMGAGSIRLPFALQEKEDLIDYLDILNKPLLTSISPNCNLSDSYVVQAMTVRGIRPDQLKRPMEQAERQMRMAAYRCSTVSEMFQLYLQCTYHRIMSHVISTPLTLPTRTPFPVEMFDPHVNKYGYLGLGSRDEHEKVVSVSSIAAVQTSDVLGDTLETLHREAKRIKICKLHRFKAAGMEDEDYAEALENLLRFKDNYDEHMDL